ncbi:hypothetical protein X943_002797 [Babesia divergens]|uniref:CID domain-containing protein n=1 Tax=Babesia divergens TaxID=32595 RepID=A0AAD9G9N7_BABDI|nr:hypothetical protein X943_002797 [Babesia divergens]
MDDNQLVEMSPLSEEDVSPSEDEEDSAFHREIILQDNYSDEETGDGSGDQDASSQTSGDSNMNDRQGDTQVNVSGHEQKRVRFTDDHAATPVMFTNNGYRGPQPGLAGVLPSPNTASGVTSFLSNGDAKMALLSSLPSSILGNAVAMSKYLSEYLSEHTDLESKLKNIQDPNKRRAFGEEIFPESALTNKFRTLDTTQVAIEEAAALAGKYPYPPGALIQLMHDVFVSMPTNAAVTRLGIFYVYNHLIHKFGTSSWTHPVSFLETGLRRFCIPAIMHSNRIHCTNTVHILTCINVWRQRQIYNAATCDQLESLISNQGARDASLESHTDTNMYTVNSEVGSVKTLKHIFNMPMVDPSFEEAIKGCDESSIIDTAAPNREQILAEAMAKGKYEAFDHSSRLSGQELILLHSSSIDLAALIEEGTKQFELLNQEIDDLQAKIKEG